MKNDILRGVSLISVVGLLTLAACAQKEVSFKADIQPLIQQYCIECHAENGEGTQKSGLLMTSYESLMKGTQFGAIVKPGDSLSSVINMLVEGRVAPAIRMPHNKTTLPREKIDLLKKWVDQGARNN